MKKFIRNIFFRFFKLLIPELGFIKQLQEERKGEVSNTVLEQPVTLYFPVRIFDSSIGKYTYVSENAFISLTTIGRFCSIGPGLLCGWGIHPINGISTSPMFYSTKKQNGFSISAIDKIAERKEINIGNDVFIGANVTILDGVTIGDGAVIGAGCVVSKDVPPYAIAVGAPMQILKYRFEEDQIKELQILQWWNWPEEKLGAVENDFFDIKEFIRKCK